MKRWITCHDKKLIGFFYEKDIPNYESLSKEDLFKHPKIRTEHYIDDDI